jgi:chemotaxis protein MotB
MTDEPIRREAKTPERGANWILRLVLISIVALALAGGAGWYAWTLRADNQSQSDELGQLRSEAVGHQVNAKRVGDLEKSLGECRERADSEQKKCAEAETSIKAMEGNLEATRAELETLRAQREQTAKRLAAFRELSAKLKKMIDSGRLDVEVRKGQMMVKLPAEVLFSSGSAELSRDGELALMEVAIALRQLKDRSFMVIGHTDSRPLEAKPDARFGDNWELSTARAVRVTKFMIEAKLPPKNLIAAGQGPHDPVGDNKTSSGRQDNRRIEIVVLPKIEELPPLLDEAGKAIGSKPEDQPE